MTARVSLLCLILCVLLLAACAPEIDPASLPPSIQENAHALDLRATADAAARVAAQSAQRAQEAAAAQRAVEARLTAVAQGTRDALAVRSTEIAQDATAAALVADATATAQARINAQTMTTQAAQHNAAGTLMAEQRITTATVLAAQQNGTATAHAYRATEAVAQQQASATDKARTATIQSERSTATLVAMFSAATATRTANQIREENEQTQWRNMLAPATACMWMLVPFALSLAILFIAVRMLFLFEQRNRVVQYGDAILLIQPGGVDWRRGRTTPPSYKILSPPAPVEPKPTPAPAPEIAEGQFREMETPPPNAPNPTVETTRELKTASTNEANAQFKLALEMLDATLTQLSKARADGEKLNGKPFSFDACHAAGFVQTWEEWGHVMDMWQASGIAERPRAKAGWGIRVTSLAQGESLLTEMYVRSGYIRTNGAWMKR